MFSTAEAISAGIVVQITTGDVMVLTEFGAAEARSQLSRPLIGAGAILAVGAPVVDPPQVMPCVQVIPRGRRLSAWTMLSLATHLPDDRHRAPPPCVVTTGMVGTAALAHHNDIQRRFLCSVPPADGSVIAARRQIGPDFRPASA